MSIFDLNQQARDLDAKIVIGIERISDGLKALIWEYAKQIGLSPIQIQIVIFLKNHDVNLCKVSYLAAEFNLSKPTISDAVRVLIQKGFVEKTISTVDARSHYLMLTIDGKQVVKNVERYNKPLVDLVASLKHPSKIDFYSVLLDLISGLNKQGVLSVQRTCFNCRYFSRRSDIAYCGLIETNLETPDIQLDCADFEQKEA